MTKINWARKPIVRGVLEPFENGAVKFFCVKSAKSRVVRWQRMVWSCPAAIRFQTSSIRTLRRDLQNPYAHHPHRELQAKPDRRIFEHNPSTDRICVHFLEGGVFGVFTPFLHQTENFGANLEFWSRF